MKILKFFTHTCLNCIMADRILVQNGIKFESIDAIENVELCEKYGVTSVPTVIILDEKGNEVERAVGITELRGIVNRGRIE